MSGRFCTSLSGAPGIRNGAFMEITFYADKPTLPLTPYQSAARPASPASRLIRPPRSGLELDRHEMIDGDQDHQKGNTKTEAEADQLLFDRQQRLDFLGGNLVL